jgi:hypothetical protein
MLRADLALKFTKTSGEALRQSAVPKCLNDKINEDARFCW